MRMRVATTLCALLACASAAPRAGAAPLTAQQLHLQGVARDLQGALLPAGGVAVRVYADPGGGSPVYDSGGEFAGAIVQGIFDVLVGETLPLSLDGDREYFLELDAAGVEVVGDAAGGRWAFHPGTGSHARGDLEARLDNLEVAMGIASPALRADLARAPAEPARAASALASQHALLGLGLVSGTDATYGVTANLLAQPVGSRRAGTVEVQLGPCYLFAPTPPPVFRFVRDVPGDQGRAVRVRWRRDLRERAYGANDTLPRVTSYTLYRRVEPGQAAARLEPGHAAARLELDHAPALRPEPDPELAVSLPPGEWDVLASVPATLDSVYQTVAQTLCDSTASGTCWSAFLVRAITDRVGTFYDSPVDSGYSVDNLAPGVPEGLAAQAVAGGTQLTWQPSTAPDFQYFRVYRGADPAFEPRPATLVHATAEPGWLDPQGGSYTYKVTALDFNGNESGPAVTTITVGVASPSYGALAFSRVAPNPFSGTLALVVDVPVRAGHVELRVFDLAGRRVRTLANGALDPGRHTFTWDGRAEDGARAAPGLYLARLTGSGRTLTRRITLLP